VGSLIRTREIIEGLRAQTLHAPYDQQKLAADVRQGIIDVVRKQVEIGIDIPNDGELGRRGFLAYINERLSGLEPRDPEPGEITSPHEPERIEFADFFKQYDQHSRFLWMYPEISMEEVRNRPANAELFRLTGPIAYTGQAAVTRDIQTLKTALEGQTVSDAFITAVTPNSRKSDADILKFYPSDEAYRYAMADVMHEEYKAITDAGFTVQLDFDALNPQGQILIGKLHASDEDFYNARELAIEVTNHALRGIPEEKVRYHHCWGSNNRPHTTDVPLEKIVNQMLKINAQAYVVEAANPRHEHEWMVWKDVKLPDGKILVPGVISQSTNVVEHPELVSWRIQHYASVVGKENVIGGVDCGFSQHWDTIRVHPTVQWAKLQSLVDGAALASEALWR
jgi:5-methyltetrahydropteroyltriglutamate--homocysteine methyltransferase